MIVETWFRSHLRLQMRNSSSRRAEINIFYNQEHLYRWFRASYLHLYQRSCTPLAKENVNIFFTELNIVFLKNSLASTTETSKLQYKRENNTYIIGVVTQKGGGGGITHRQTQYTQWKMGQRSVCGFIAQPHYLSICVDLWVYTL